MSTNRFKGECTCCGKSVPAGAGIHEQGKLTCSETVPVRITLMESIWVCIPEFNIRFGVHLADIDEAYEFEFARRLKEDTERQETTRLHLVNGGLEDLAVKASVRSLAQVIAKFAKTESELNDLTFEQAVLVRNELNKRIQRKASAKRLDEFKASDTCSRCGGAGRADKWSQTGYTCYQCGGSGKYFNEGKAK
jgi:hypothetical protein